MRGAPGNEGCDLTRFSARDIDRFRHGSHTRLCDHFGSHICTCDGERGTYFAVWAPAAASVSVIGDFNDWDAGVHPLHRCTGDAGIWEGFVPGVDRGDRYKYHVASTQDAYASERGDPFARYWEGPPGTASVVWNPAYRWEDGAWMRTRARRHDPGAPLAIYEAHLGSWRRVPEEGDRPLSYREIAVPLAEHIVDAGFTHVEFLPVMEHPFYGSWGYQTCGYFAPTSRYGTPEDFMHLIDTLHRHDIGVILDWVPSHFPDNSHALVFFDGTHLYEHPDPRRGFNPEWNSYVFDYGKHEVRQFLINSALFWLEQYHADGLRVDAVASMIYLDYGRDDGRWLPNVHGGRENLEAVAFLRTLNRHIADRCPGALRIAEESSEWPRVTGRLYSGGLSFDLKWNMGWMHDTLRYFTQDPLFRKHAHQHLTFSRVYAFKEQFLLPLSHDEVVYGKRSLLNKMPGDNWQQRANLRILLGYQYTHPGKKLLFMGGEFGQWREWYHEASLDWHLLNTPAHAGIFAWVAALNRLYRCEPALHECDFEPQGFEWIDCADADQSVLVFLRRGKSSPEPLVVVCNFTPVPRSGYRVGVPLPGRWSEVLNSDAVRFGGSGVITGSVRTTEPVACHGRDHSLVLTLPPLSLLVLRRTGAGV
ncbi:MAG TPA: 1,4-alpha-glucan branching protein GlgB [Methanoculleus sp.]|nr:1,4-alpha-glucan branching protein GlgB [Methanoculleus sp.]